VDNADNYILADARSDHLHLTVYYSISQFLHGGLDHPQTAAHLTAQDGVSNAAAQLQMCAQFQRQLECILVSLRKQGKHARVRPYMGPGACPVQLQHSNHLCTEDSWIQEMAYAADSQEDPERDLWWSSSDCAEKER